MDTWPEKQVAGNGLLTRANPTWCIACKQQINPGDPVTRGKWFNACVNPKCIEYFRMWDENPGYEGPRFFNPLFQHLRFQDRNISNGYFPKKPYISWEEWCQDQAKTVGSKKGVCFLLDYKEQWENFPAQFRD